VPSWRIVTPEKVAVVGSSEGADVEHVERFCREMYAYDPTIILVSGGDKSHELMSVDWRAEQTWLSLGGAVISFRPKPLSPYDFEPVWGIERWELGGEQPRVWSPAEDPHFADRTSVCFYRNILIAEECDRLALFHKPGWSGGGGHTEGVARDLGKPTHVYEKER